MRITIFGAGAMGTLYGALLGASGHAVTVVARGARAAAMAEHGLRTRQRGRAAVHVERVAVAPDLAAAGPADAVLVLVRRQSIDGVLPLLAAQPSDVVMMVNVASGYAAWRAALGARLLVGFPGATGRFVDGDVLEHEIAPRLLQPTVLGEPAGAPTERVRALGAALRDAGFPTQLRADMEAWHRTHAAWMAPFMLTAAAAHQDDVAFVARASIRRWIDALREGVASLAARGVRPTPAAIRLAARLPPGLLAGLVRAVFSASRPLRAHLLATGTASADEGRALAAEILAEARAHGQPLPVLEELLSAASA